MWRCTLKPGDTVNLGNQTVLHVVGTSSGRVQIGIEAPQEVALLHHSAARNAPGIVADQLSDRMCEPNVRTSED